MEPDGKKHCASQTYRFARVKPTVFNEKVGVKPTYIPDERCVVEEDETGCLFARHTYVLNQGMLPVRGGYFPDEQRIRNKDEFRVKQFAAF